MRRETDEDDRIGGNAGPGTSGIEPCAGRRHERFRSRSGGPGFPDAALGTGGTNAGDGTGTGATSAGMMTNGGSIDTPASVQKSRQENGQRPKIILPPAGAAATPKPQ